MNGRTFRLFIPNALTALNLLGGLAATILAWRGYPLPACWMILLCTLLDGLDGWAARRMGGESVFGKWFDSGADLISFGLAPALLFWRSGGPEAAGGVYLFCAAARLIRFQRMPEKERGGYFVGLPTTASGALYAAGRLWAPALSGPTVLHTGGILALAGLMISRLHFLRITGSAEARPAIPSQFRPGRSGTAPAARPSSVDPAPAAPAAATSPASSIS